MSFRPLYDRLTVKRLEETEKSAGGIIIPDVAKEKPGEGTVTAIGDGRLTTEGTLVPLRVRVGDHVYFGKYSGTEVKVGGETHLILREDDVLGIASSGQGTPATPGGSAA